MRKICLFFLLTFLICGIAQGQETAPEKTPVIETAHLNSGREMPLLGVNVSAVTAIQAENTVYAALAEGFRLIDVSGSSGNEEAVGRAVRRAIDEKLVTREEIFLCAGILQDETDAEAEPDDEKSDALVAGSLELLGVDYLDLMILRQNRYDQDLSAWKAMERAAENGKIRSLGLSGFTDIRNYDLFLNNAVTRQPDVLQIPVHPYQQRTDMRKHLAGSGVVLMTEYPLGGEKEEQVLFADPVISTNATWYSKTSEQVILRWQYQTGTIAVPTVLDEFQIDEYYHIFDFELSEKEISEMRPARNRRP